MQSETSTDFIADALEVSSCPAWLASQLSKPALLNYHGTDRCPHGPDCPYFLQDDIFEWHFVVRGPPDTEFEVCMTSKGLVSVSQLVSSITLWL